MSSPVSETDYLIDPTLDSSEHDEITMPKIRRRIFGGYDRDTVHEHIAAREHEIRLLTERLDSTTTELADTEEQRRDLHRDLSRSRAELRYWNDRSSYVDSEVRRARELAASLEKDARERANDIETDAQGRALQLIDRVCEESNAMLHHARMEAREMFLRFEGEVDMSQQRLEQMGAARDKIASTMQEAFATFEKAMRAFDASSPSRSVIEASALPERRAVPTFGQDRAVEAANRFERMADDHGQRALQSPLTEAPETTITPERVEVGTTKPVTEPVDDNAPTMTVLSATIAASD